MSFSNFYILSQIKLPEKHTLHSGTYTYIYRSAPPGEGGGRERAKNRKLRDPSGGRRSRPCSLRLAAYWISQLRHFQFFAPFTILVLSVTYFLGWLKGYGPRLGTTNGSTNSSCFVSFGSSSSCLRFLLSGASGNVILQGWEKVRNVKRAFTRRNLRNLAQSLRQLVAKRSVIQVARKLRVP